MLIAKESVETRATKEAIWQIWKDVSNWKSWDAGLEYSEIDGPFAKGTRGHLKPKDGPLIKTLLTEVIPYQSFVDEASLPLTKIIMRHWIGEKGGVRIVTQQIEMKGLLALFFALVIGLKIKKNLRSEMLAMCKQAESRS